MKYRWLSFLCALTATLLAGALAFAHFSDASLPGCGQGHACDELSNGVWGNILGLPVAFLGTAWFAALAFVLLPEGGAKLPKSVLLAAVAGLPASLVFVGVMFVERKLCPYCAGVHGANLLMCVFVWLSSRVGTAHQQAAAVDVLGSTPDMAEGADTEQREDHVDVVSGAQPTIGEEFGWLKTFVPVFAAAIAVLLFLGHRRDGQLATEEQIAIQQTVEQVLATGETKSAAEITGRHIHGNDNARWRIVIFHDYCCADCGSLHRYLPKLLAGRSDISVAYRQFPLCAECNPAFADQDGHRQACQAARLTEAAAELHGQEGFEQLSDWLFDHKGEFSDDELQAALTQWNWPAEELLRLSESESVRAQVAADVQYSDDQSVRITPTVFINGVLLQGKTGTAGRLRGLFAALSE